MTSRILIKRGTATQWTNSTTALLAGELGLDTSNNIIKVGDGTTLWNSLSGLTLTSAQVSELAQDAIKTAIDAGTHTNMSVVFNDEANTLSISTGPDVVTTTSLGNTLNDPSTGYVPIGDVGNVDGVAPLDENALIPDQYIPAGIARDSEVSTAIANLVNSAPSTLDTLNELATALGNDANFSTTITNSIGGKVSKSGGDTITPATTSTIGLTLASPVGQTGHLLYAAGGTRIPAGGNYLVTPGLTVSYVSDFNAGAANITPIYVKGAASQTANLQEWQNSSGTALSYITKDGGFQSSDKLVSARIFILQDGGTPTNGGYWSNYYIGWNSGIAILPNGSVGNIVPFMVKGAASQTANLQEWQNSSGTMLAKVTSGGAGMLTGLTVFGTQYQSGNALVLLEAAATTGIPLAVRGAASQTADLQQWQNSAGTILSRIDSSGAMYTITPSANTNTTQVATTAYVQTALDPKLNIVEPSIDYYITNSGSGAYIVNGVSNGLISFEKGKRYRIYVNASGHPFWIQTVSGAYSSGNVYSTGITGNGTQVGSIVVELPQNAPAGLYYACQFHSSMAGAISVKDAGVQTTTNAQAGSYTVSVIDSDKLIEMSGGGTLTITDSSSFPTGFTVNVLQTGSSQVTIAGNGFTVNGTPGLKLRAQWSSATLVKRGLNSWVAMGDLSA